MGREVDERKKRKALRKLRKAAALAEQGLGPPLSDWEREFLEEVEARVEKYGSAFHDLEKGGADEPLSALQNLKLREIDKKARGKGKSGFKTRKTLGQKNKPAFKPNVRQIDEDLEPPAPPPRKPEKPKLVKASELLPKVDAPPPTPAKPRERPVFRVIKGGAEED